MRRAPRSTRRQARGTSAGNGRSAYGGYSTHRIAGFVICYISELDGPQRTDGVVCGAARLQRAGKPRRGTAGRRRPLVGEARGAPPAERGGGVAPAWATGRPAVLC